MARPKIEDRGEVKSILTISIEEKYLVNQDKNVLRKIAYDSIVEKHNLQKPELIKQAYGEFYEEVKDSLDENGWCVLNISQKHPINSFAHSQNKTEWKPINGRACWRPKSISHLN